MATTVNSDLVIYNDLAQTAYLERIQDVIDIFNAASAGAFVLANELIEGDLRKRAFYKLDINGYLIAYSIDVQTDGGAWQTVINSAFNGKASNPYQRTHRVGAIIQVPPISRLPVGTQVPPTNVHISSHQVVEQGIANNVMTIEWTAAEGAASYKVEWQKDSGQWIQAGTVSTTSVDVVGIYTGTGAVNGQSVADPTALQDYWRNTIGRGALQKELMTEIDAANGVAGQVQQQAKDIVKNAQDIAKEILDRQSADQGLGSFITTVSQKTDDAAAQVSRLTTRTGDAENNIVTLQRTTGEQATQLSQLGTTVGQHTASITNLQQTQANQANQISELQVSSAPPVKAGADSTKAGANVRKAGIYTYSVARVDGDLAEAIKTEQLTAQVGGYSAQILTISQAQARLDGKVSASLSTKVGVTADGKYYSAGYAIGIDNSGGTVQSQFLVSVDTFAVIANAGGGAVMYPFVIQGGQTFISQALIGKGWITDAMIGNSIQATAVDGLGRPIWELNKTTGFVQRSADASGSSELTAKSLNFYDTNGALRVRLGRWT